MFCPVCHDEFRPGFTRCASCGVDLVASLDGSATAAPEPDQAPDDEPRSDPGEPAVNYCGFLDLESAREAKAALGRAGLRAEVLIRDADGIGGKEEYWLRVPPSSFARAMGVLGYDESGGATGDEAGEDEVLCSACGAVVDAEADRCSACGEPFEEA